MRFRVLGAIEAATVDGVEVALAGPKEKAVLALLLVARGEAVGTDRLVDELWPDSPASAARKTAQAYVSRLGSKLVRPDGSRLIRSLPSGYSIPATSRTVDAELLEQALDGAPASGDGALAEKASTALDLWRGQPFADAFATPALEAESVRLEEVRLTLFEHLADERLQRGEHSEVVPSIQHQAAANPYRERLWWLLMLALYRSGRQAEALRAYSTLTANLADVGLIPSGDLSGLEARILERDPALDPPRSDDAGPRKRPSRRSRVIVATAVGVVLLAALASVVSVVTSEDEEPGLEVEVAARYPIADAASSVVAAGGRLWLVGTGSSVIIAVEPEVGSSVDYALPEPISAAAAGSGRIWMLAPDSGSLMWMDTESGSVTAVASDLALEDAALEVTADAVWIIRERDAPFLRYDPALGALTTLPFRDPVGGPVQPDIAVLDGMIWASNAYIGRVMALQPGSSEPASFAGETASADHAVKSIVADRGSIWFSQPTNGTIARVDPATSAVTATVELGAQTSSGFGRSVRAFVLEPGPGGLWVALPADGRVVLVDQDNAAVITQISFQQPTGIAVSRGLVWVVDARAHELVGIDPHVCEELPFVGPGADLRGCDLSGLPLIGVDLSGADLRWANLSQVGLGTVDLTGADLYGAIFSPVLVETVTWQDTRCPDGSMSEQKGGACRAELP